MASISGRKSGAFETNAASRCQHVEQYLAKHRVLEVIQAALTKLALAYKTKHELPANPYPSLLAAFRQAEQLQPAVGKGNTRAPLTLELAPGPENQLRVPELRVFALNGAQPPIWGLRSSLERTISPHTLASSVSLLGKLFPPWTKDSELQDDGYAVTAFTTLVGNCTVLPVADHHVISTEQHLFVRGEQLECAMELFAKHLLKFLHERKRLKAGSSDAVQALGSGGVNFISSTGGKSQYLLEDANSNRNAFTNAVKTALVSQAQFQSTSFFCVSQQQPSVIKAENAFFFHFTSSSSDGKQPKASRVASNRSFLVGTRVKESGIFLSSQAAISITERLEPNNPLGQSSTRNQNKPKPLSAEAVSPMSKVSPGTPESTAVLERTLSSFQASLSPKSTEMAREWSCQFTDSVAFSLLCVVASNQLLIHILECVSPEAQQQSSLRTQFAVARERMSDLLERAKLATASSLLLGVEAMLENAWQHVQDAVGTGAYPSTDCIEPLKLVNALLMVVAKSAAEDFMQLAKSQSESEQPKLNANAQPEQENQLNAAHDENELVDVMFVLDQAATQRTYPACILEEAAFAQWLVDSCADIALESAVMHLVAFCLPPNAFVGLSGYVRVFALRQLVWSRSLTSVPLVLDPEQLCWHDTDQVCSIPWSSDGAKRLYSASPMLLRLLSVQRMNEWHQTLLELQIYRASDYIPSKSSYSVQVLVSMQLYHPIVLANRTTSEPPATLMYGEMDVMEHVVVEGADFDQALYFFADAVASDLQRLARLQWFAPVRVELLDPKAQHIAFVAVLEHSRESLLEVIREASAAQCLLQIRIVHCHVQTSSAIAQSVTKSYAFHHRPTDKRGLMATLLSDVVWTRLCHFGVFQSLEDARLVLGRASKPTVERSHWTPYGQQALATRDLLLINQLELADESYTQRDQAWEHQLQRLVNHSDLVDLYNLVSDHEAWVFSSHAAGLPIATSRSQEAASRWLLHQIQEDDRLDEGTPRLATSGALITPISSRTRTYAAFARGLVAAAKHSVTRINKAMRYIDCAELPSIQRALEDMLPSVKEKQHQSEQLWVPELRRLWSLFAYVRFSYQRDFYANYATER